MGPRPGGHGKESHRGHFAEATVSFQWGHDPEVMVSGAFDATEALMIAFQWGHDPEVMVRQTFFYQSDSTKVGFNGATTRRSW